MKHGVLIIMARAPRFGAVKTRLARDIGPLNAWRFYRNTLRATVNRLRQNTSWRTVLQITPDREKSAGRQWPTADNILGQGRGGLGCRMERGLTGFPRGTPIVLIGSDIPGVTKHHIREAFKALSHADVVFGPAEDGGYWLVGFANRRPVRGAFSNIRWSTVHTLEDTRHNIRNRRVALVQTMSDVDDGKSYEKLRPQFSK